MGELAEWRNQDWVRIGTDGKLKVSVVLLRIRRIQIDVYLEAKQVV